MTLNKNLVHSVHFFHSLSFRIVSLVVGLIIVSMCTAGWFLLKDISKSMRKSVEKQLLTSNKILQKDIQREFEFLIQNMRLLAVTPDFMNLDTARMSSALKNEESKKVFYPGERVSVIGLNGIEIANNDLSMQLRNRSDLKLSKNYQETSRTFFSPKLEWKKRLPNWTLVTFIHGTQHEAYLAATVGIRRIWHSVDNLKPGENGEAFVVFSDGQLIAHPDHAKVVKRTNLKDLAPVQKLLENQSGMMRYTDHSGKTFECVYQKVPQLGLGIVTQVPENGIRLQILAASKTALIVILIIISFAIFLSIIFVRKSLKPVSALVQSTRSIADGNLNTKINIPSTKNEIGILAHDFENMRNNLQIFTNHLQELVDEKIRQNREILANIEQGLFSISLDGVIQSEHSDSALKILQVDQLAQKNITEIFSLENADKRAFFEWIEYVQMRFQKTRWKKLTKLSPLQETTIEWDSGAFHHIEITYQKMLDKNGSLYNLMVLVRDVTEERILAQKIAKQKLLHENQVNTFIAISRNPPEFLDEFLNEFEMCRAPLEEWIDNIYKELQLERSLHPTGPACKITPQDTVEILRSLHTLKGNAGSYGFQIIVNEAHQMESILEELSSNPKVRRSDLVDRLVEHLKMLKECIVDLKKEIDKFHNQNGHEFIPIHGVKVNRLKSLAKESLVIPELIDQLRTECDEIQYIPTEILVRKYFDLVDRINKRRAHPVELILEDETMELSPEALKFADKAIIQVLRNAMTHAFPPDLPEEKRLLIILRLQKDEDSLHVEIEDNGVGAQFEKLKEVAIRANKCTPELWNQLNQEEQLQYILQPSISTMNTVSEDAGRGIGLYSAQKSLEECSGLIRIENKQKSSGLIFEIIVPLRAQS